MAEVARQGQPLAEGRERDVPAGLGVANEGFPMTFDPSVSSFRYPAIANTTERVKEKWFAWRQYGRLPDVLRDSLGAHHDLVGEAGWDAATSALDRLDTEFERLLSSHSAVRIWTCSRHVSPVYWAPQGWRSHESVRRVSEMAIERYGSPSNTVGDLDWSEAEVKVAGRCLAIAEAYARLMVARRRIAKGQTAAVLEWAPLQMSFQDDADLERLIEIRDRRVLEDQNPLAALASLAPPHRHPVHPRELKLVSAKYADPEELQQDVNRGVPLRTAPTSYGHDVLQIDVVTNWGDTRGARELEELFQPYDTALHTDLGYTMSDLLVLNSLFTRVLFPSGNPKPIPTELEFCGYATVPRSEIDLALAGSAAEQLGLDQAREVTAKSVAAAFDALCKRPDTANLRSLGRRPIWCLADTLLVDLVSFNLEYHLVNHLASKDYFTDQNPFDFEQRVHSELGEQGQQPFQSGRKVKVDDEYLTDIDASVLVDGTLITVDCYASPWRDDLDAGSHRATRNREEALVKKLRDWDRKMRALADAPPDWLTSAGVREILPVVVTASAEWIGDASSDLWFTTELPRACTTDELINQVLPDPTLWGHRIQVLGDS